MSNQDKHMGFSVVEENATLNYVTHIVTKYRLSGCGIDGSKNRT